ncbi:hypothetical protein SEA_EMOTION_72 [Arthrobacter phage Emotion]|uniref:Uncharacterized protein n=1 Tax=Arthrobacter phage Emotion TaxID=3038361 RepID=A0AA49ES86_9CAUD|nr:hypothetical protein SEA_EMOTION_72 [Arthrobacter phage Emotion]
MRGRMTAEFRARARTLPAPLLGTSPSDSRAPLAVESLGLSLAHLPIVYTLYC